MPSVTPTVQSDEIRSLAYTFWQERGCPAGTPELDWFRAENQLLNITGEHTETVLETLAKNIGAAIGIVARL